MMECHQTDQRFHSLGQAQGLSQQNDMSKWKEMGKHIKERNDKPVWMGRAERVVQCTESRVIHREIAAEQMSQHVILRHTEITEHMYPRKGHNKSTEWNKVWKTRGENALERMTGESKMTHSRKLIEKRGEVRLECGRDERLQESGTSPAVSRLLWCLSPQRRDRTVKQDNESCQSKALKCLCLSQKN